MMPMVYDSCRDPETVDGPGAAAAVACAYTAGGASLSTVAGLERVAADYLTFGVQPSQLVRALHFPPLPLSFSYKSEKSLCGAGTHDQLV